MSNQQLQKSFLHKIQTVKITLIILIISPLVAFTYFELNIGHQKDMDSDFRQEFGSENRKIHYLLAENGPFEEFKKDPNAVEECVGLILEMRKEKIRKYLNDNPKTTIAFAELAEWQFALERRSEELKEFHDKYVANQY